MPKLLLCNSQKGWPFFQRLLGDLFKFMEPYLRNAELGQPVSSIPAPSVAVVLYSLRSELLVAEIDVSRCILVLDTSISETSNSERREY